MKNNNNNKQDGFALIGAVLGSILVSALFAGAIIFYNTWSKVVERDANIAQTVAEIAQIREATGAYISEVKEWPNYKNQAGLNYDNNVHAKWGNKFIKSIGSVDSFKANRFKLLHSTNIEDATRTAVIEIVGGDSNKCFYAIPRLTTKMPTTATATVLYRVLDINTDEVVGKTYLKSNFNGESPLKDKGGNSVYYLTSCDEDNFNISVILDSKAKAKLLDNKLPNSKMSVEPISEADGNIVNVYVVMSSFPKTASNTKYLEDFLEAKDYVKRNDEGLLLDKEGFAYEDSFPKAVLMDQRKIDIAHRIVPKPTCRIQSQTNPDDWRIGYAKIEFVPSFIGKKIGANIGPKWGELPIKEDKACVAACKGKAGHKIRMVDGKWSSGVSINVDGANIINTTGQPLTDSSAKILRDGSCQLGSSSENIIPEANFWFLDAISGDSEIINGGTTSVVCDKINHIEVTGIAKTYCDYGDLRRRNVDNEGLGKQDDQAHNELWDLSKTGLTFIGTCENTKPKPNSNTEFNTSESGFYHKNPTYHRGFRAPTSGVTTIGTGNNAIELRRYAFTPCIKNDDEGRALLGEMKNLCGSSGKNICGVVDESYSVITSVSAP